jgi:hypothetical protein
MYVDKRERAVTSKNTDTFYLLATIEDAAHHFWKTRTSYGYNNITIDVKHKLSLSLRGSPE